MKKIIFVLFFVSIFFYISCSEDDSTNPTTLKKYPTELGNEWEYNTKMTIEYYDTSGNIIDQETLDLGNTIVKIIKENDTLGIYKNLVKFECYDLQTQNYKNYSWYSNSDSGLTIIAYSNAGSSQWVWPKINSQRYITIKELLSIIKSPDLDIFTFSTSNTMDSFYYYEIPRQVLAYPLTINKRWVELVYPWYRERYVARIFQEIFQGQALRCYVIKVYWPDYDIEINDYISLEKGLIKREILADSIIISDPISPDSGGFGRFSSYSNLVKIVE